MNPFHRRGIWLNANLQNALDGPPSPLELGAGSRKREGGGAQARTNQTAAEAGLDGRGARYHHSLREAEEVPSRLL